MRLRLNDPVIYPDAVEVLKDILLSEWVSALGPAVEEFERQVASYTGVRYAFATASGTSALHLALLSVGIGRGDVVLVPDITFIATVNAVSYVGALPVFVDADDDLNMSVAWVKRFISKACGRRGKRLTFEGRPVKAVLVTHVMGNPADVNALKSVCAENNLVLIEDSAEALGSKLNGVSLGTFGDVGILSFNGNKIITTGAGGMLLTNRRKVYSRARHLGTQAKDDPLYYLHGEVGYNYRMSALQAGLGLSQLGYLPEHLKKKRTIHRWYSSALRGEGSLKLVRPKRGQANYWLNVLRLEFPRARQVRDYLLKGLNARGIQSRPLWMANHLQAPYLGAPYFGRGKSLDLVERCICLPSDVRLLDDDVDRVVYEIKRMLDEGGRYGKGGLL